MRSPPVNFSLLRQFLDVARVDEDQTAKCLRRFLVQTALYAPSPERDHVRGLVELATDHRNLIPTAINALDEWARSAATATETGRTVAERRVKANFSSSKGGRAPRLQKQIEHDEWIEEMDKMLERNRTPHPRRYGPVNFRPARR